jgi:hypothetical protein
MGYVGLAVAFLLTPAAARSANLQDAFRSAFGQAAPMIRHTKLRNVGETDLSLEPVLLIHVGGRRFALVVSESFDGGYWAPGDVAVAYLDRDSTGWRPVNVWYEFAQSGSFGEPFSRQKVLSFNFGGTPFFAGDGELCGMGACTSSYELIAFSPDRPTDWGWIPDSASDESLGPLTMPDGSRESSLPDFKSDGETYTGCGGYEYSSVISAPGKSGDLMRVTYTGWMLPGGNGQKRSYFQFYSELSLAHGKMIFRPEVKLPNCGS